MNQQDHNVQSSKLALGGSSAFPAPPSSSTESARVDLARYTPSAGSNNIFGGPPFYGPHWQAQTNPNRNQSQAFPVLTAPPQTHQDVVRPPQGNQPIPNQQMAPPSNPQSRGPPIQTQPSLSGSTSVNDNHPQVYQHQQGHYPQPMTPQSPDPKTQRRIQATARAQALLSSNSPLFEKFLTSVIGTVATEIYSLSESCAQEISKSKDYFHRTAQDTINAEWARSKENIDSITEKHRGLEVENEDIRRQLESACQQSQKLVSACKVLLAQNDQLKRELDLSRRQLEHKVQSTFDEAGRIKDISDSTVSSKVAESNIPPDVINQLRKEVASGYERNLIQSSLEARKYKKKCAELEKRLEERRESLNAEESLSDHATTVTLDQTPKIPETSPEPQEGHSSTSHPQETPTLQNTRPAGTQIIKKDLDDNSNPLPAQDVIDLTMEDDDNDRPSPNRFACDNERIQEASVLKLPESTSDKSQSMSMLAVSSNPTASAAVVPLLPSEQIHKASTPRSCTSLSIDIPLISSIPLHRKRRDESPLLSESPSPTKRQRTTLNDHASETSSASASGSATRSLSSTKEQSPSVGRGQSSSSVIMESSHSDLNDALATVVVKKESVDGSLDQQLQQSSPREQKMSIKHIRLAYSVEKKKMICRLCLLRQKEIDSKAPVTRFPISAAWNDLSGHIQDQHPQGHSLLVQMTDAEIAVMTRTIAAEEGKAG